MYRIWYQKAFGDYKSSHVYSASYYVKGREKAKEYYNKLCLWFVEEDEDFVFGYVYDKYSENIVEKYKLEIDELSLEEERKLVMEYIRKELHKDPVRFLKKYGDCLQSNEDYYVDAFVGVAMEKVKESTSFPFSVNDS